MVLMLGDSEVPYQTVANTSFATGEHLPFDSWRWGHRVETLLVRKDDVYVFEGDTPDPEKVNPNTTSVSLEFNFPWNATEEGLRLVVRSKNSSFGKRPTPRQVGNQSQSLEEQCAEAAYQELLKGQSYSFGKIQVRNSEEASSEAREVYSFTPSRIRFPWSFLWDDGFHLEVVARRDPEKAVRVIASWLATMTEEGWIPREQSRGKEREFLCDCDKFLVKDSRDGNPPSLILPLFHLAEQHPDLLLAKFGMHNFLLVKRWYKWYFKTQLPNKTEYLFKWFDSIDVTQPGGGSFNSGLDDFPRKPLNESARQVWHIDAQSWMYEFTRLIVKLTEIF